LQVGLAAFAFFPFQRVQNTASQHFWCLVLVPQSRRSQDLSNRIIFFHVKHEQNSAEYVDVSLPVRRYISPVLQCRKVKYTDEFI